MQKKLIALAVAGLVSAPVFAQSNVTVYGVVDAFVGTQKSSNSTGTDGDKTFSGVQGGGMSGSRLGFRGTEDLGNGLKAVFTLEYSLANDVNAGIGNTGGLNARQQFVGLEGGFGFIGLGRQYAAGYYSYMYDVTGAASPFSPHSIGSLAIGASITPNSAARVDNAINYKTPNMGGFQANATYGFGETNQGRGNREGDYAALGLTYANGPLAAGVILHHKRVDARGGSAAVAAQANLITGVVTPAVAATTGDNKLGNQREWLAGASYNFGVVKLAGSYQKLDTSEQGLDNEGKVWQLGVSAPVGKGELMLAFARAQNEKAAGVKVTNGDSDIWSLAYSHPLSKRTNTYAAFTRVNNEAGATASAVTKPAAGADTNSIVVGVRHAF